MWNKFSIETTGITVATTTGITAETVTTIAPIEGTATMVDTIAATTGTTPALS
jgi:hypothetical protein